MENIFLVLDLTGNGGEYLGPGSDGGDVVSTKYGVQILVESLL